MKTILTLARRAVVVLLAFTAASVSAQETTFRELVEVLVSENTEVRQARKRAELAELGYESVIDAARPRLSASISPLYGVSTRRGSDFTAIESIADFPPSPVTTTTHSFGAGLSYRQLLPTAGSLTADTTARLDATRSGDSDPSFSLAPTLSITASQPLFTEGDLFDSESRTLSERASRIGRDRAELLVTVTENRLVRQLAGLYVQAVSTRLAAALQERQVALAEQRLENAKVNAEQGRGATSDILRQEVALGTSRSRLLEAESALLELSGQLGELLERPVSIAALSEDLPMLSGGSGESGVPNAAVEVGRMSFAEAQARAALASRTPAATLTIALAVSPRYRDERRRADEVVGAFTDYSGEGAGVNVQFSATVDVPIYSGRENELSAARSAVEEELSGLDLADAEGRTGRRVALLRSRRDILERRVELLRGELAFQTDLIEREEALQDEESSTADLVEIVQIQADAIRNQVWQIESDIFLLDLELADLTTHKLVESVVY